MNPTDGGPVLDLGAVRRRFADATASYRTADPFPHAVFDDLLAADAFAAAARAFPAHDSPHWTGYLHVNERKYGNTRAASWPAELTAVAAALTSPGFVAALEAMTGIEGLRPDPDLDGGGLHRTVGGGYLNVHADFTAHHTRPTWRRRVNLLLYLNAEWDASWGGELELWDETVTRVVRRVEPVGNRAVVFDTSERSFHGHPDPLRTPDGVARNSLALYYFTEEAAPTVRSTNYRPRPGDGVRAVAIHADRVALRAYDSVKRRFGIDDATVSRMLTRLHRRTNRYDGRP